MADSFGNALERISSQGAAWWGMDSLSDLAQCHSRCLVGSESGDDRRDLTSDAVGPARDFGRMAKREAKRQNGRDQRDECGQRSDKAGRTSRFRIRVARQHDDGLGFARFEDVVLPEKAGQRTLAIARCRPIEDCFESSSSLGGRSDSPGRPWSKTSMHEADDRTWHIMSRRSQSGIASRFHAGQQRLGCILLGHFVGRVAGEHLVEDASEGEEVRAGIDTFATKLFRRHIGGSADRRSGSREGDAARVEGESEIGDLDLAVSTDQQILGFQISMQRTLCVNRFESSGHFECDGRGDSPGQARFTGENLRQIESVDEFRGDILGAAVLESIVDTDDVGMMKPSGRDRFPFESRDELWIDGQFGLDSFQHGESVETLLTSQNHDAHSATSEFAFDGEAAEPSTHEGG